MADTLIDAGPLIALIDPRDDAHEKCKTALEGLILPLITTWPAFTEAMYFLHRSGGWPHQQTLWGFIEDESLTLHIASRQEQDRMRMLMEQYRDTPMDLADASLVSAAETLKFHRIFTLDSHFRIYRMLDGDSFEPVP